MELVEARYMKAVAVKVQEAMQHQNAVSTVLDQIAKAIGEAASQGEQELTFEVTLSELAVEAIVLALKLKEYAVAFGEYEDKTVFLVEW